MSYTRQETRETDTLARSDWDESPEGKPKTIEKDLSITPEIRGEESDSEISNTNEFHSDVYCPIEDNQQKPYITTQPKKKSNSKRTLHPSRLNSNKMCGVVPPLNLERIERDNQMLTDRTKSDNVFGYTPYDTGMVRSNFTSMLTSLPQQSSLLNSSIKAAWKKGLVDSKNSTVKISRNREVLKDHLLSL